MRLCPRRLASGWLSLSAAAEHQQRRREGGVGLVLRGEPSPRERSAVYIPVMFVVFCPVFILF